MAVELAAQTEVFGAWPLTPGLTIVQRFRIELGVLTLVLVMASTAHAADQAAVIAGVVRDSSGVPQMGAVVQILSADAVVRATAYTDLQGRYSIGSLLPGNYGVRATAALLLPALRSNLRLAPGHRSIVNLTLGALFNESAWLPTQPRARDEASDDWNWTLRSSAGRPILKLGDDDEMSPAAPTEAGRLKARTRVRAEVTSPSRRLGSGGTRTGLHGQRANGDGSGVSVDASVGADAGARPGLGAPSEVSTSYLRPLGVGGEVVSRVTYTSHPEISVGAGTSGLKILRVASAERFELGDLAEVEAGNEMQTLVGPASVTVMRPFAQIALHPSALWVIRYNLASAPGMQGFEDASVEDRSVPAYAFMGGRMRAAGGFHQEIAVSHQSKGTLLEVAYYADGLDYVALSGVRGRGAEAISSGDPSEEPGLMSDESNGTFEALGPGYSASGVNLLVTQKIGEGTSVTVQYSTGAALARAAEPTVTDSGALASMQARKGQEATVSLRAKIAGSKTTARVSYRWQPGVLVSAIDPYDELAGGEYLSFHVRQPLMRSGFLPDGMELTADGTNVLRQGYGRMEGRGDVPMYLAASPMSFQAGLAFTF